MEVISVGPWGIEEGTRFSNQINNGRIQKLVVVHEGGIKSLTIENAAETLSSKKNISVSPQNHQPSSVIKPQIPPANIIKTSDFSQGIGAYWKKRGDGCTLEVVSGPTVISCDQKNYVLVSKRREIWNGLQQDITKEVCVGCIYEIVAYVSVKGGNGQKFQMNATVEIERKDSSKFYIHAGRYGYLDFVHNLDSNL
ncbi:hypothetical protein KSP39_PZI006443 [Platanthera zijinensis]|uniref:CBM-cenC domain-containing protein n=1 Tax=Platanthera zijinensis TaxID=2320716 RepID=A0AAP0BQN1_9ASPA